jgi:hypothetical protein
MKSIGLTDFGITKLALTSRQYDKLLGTYMVSLDFGSPWVWLIALSSPMGEDASPFPALRKTSILQSLYQSCLGISTKHGSKETSNIS